MRKKSERPGIVVIIPSYNCAPQIPRVLAGFDKKLLARVSEVIVVNNQSPDDTVKEALKAAKKIGSRKIKVATNKENVSLGGTHKVGFLYGKKVGADYVAILHGDDQAETKELNNLIDIVEKDPAVDAVLGSRFMKESNLKGYDWKRIWGNKVLNALFSIVMIKPTKDLGSGLNIFKLSALDEKQFINFGDDLAFNYDLLLYLYTSKANIVFAPITWKEEDQVSNARNFKIAKLAALRLFKWRFGIPPKNPAGRSKSVYVFKEEK
jgi:glycosyltransferase involved in cell wall biosynthesis